MSRTSRTGKDVLLELIEKADDYKLFIDSNRVRRLNDGAENAKLVGNLVQHASEEDRKLLEQLTSEEIAEIVFAGYQFARPERPQRDRVRGPVKLSK